jgi:hypothetical protein
MSNIYAATGGGNFTFDELFPLATIAYPDVIRGWLWDPILGRELKELEQCLGDTGGRLDRKRLLNEAAWFNPALRQRLPLLQPATEVFTLLHQMRGNAFYLTHGEAAIDWMFPPDEVNWSGALIRRHLCWPHHRVPIKIDRNTMYFNRRNSARNIALYHDKLSRKTKKPCVHLCYRMRGNPMLLKHRLATLQDWISVDYRAFFAAILLFADLDYGRLGHLLRNKQSRSKDRSGGHGRSHKVSDRRDGFLDFQEHGRIEDSDYWSVQKYLDQRRNYVNVRSCMVELDNRDLLPKARDTSHGICIIPISSFDLGPSHRDNFHLSTSPHLHSILLVIPIHRSVIFHVHDIELVIVEVDSMTFLTIVNIVTDPIRSMSSPDMLKVQVRIFSYWRMIPCRSGVNLRWPVD